MSRSLERYQEVHQLLKYRTREMDSQQVQEYVSTQDKHGMQCIHWAMLCQNDDVISFLLRSGADINAQTENGFTPLHLALLKIGNPTELKRFTEGRYYSYLCRYSAYRGLDKIKSTIALSSLVQPNLDLPDKCGFHAVLAATIFRGSTAGLVLINYFSVQPRVILDYILSSLYSTHVSVSKQSAGIRKVLAAQVKQGILPSNADFLTITEPQNVQQVSDLLRSTNILIYILDVTIGLPNPVLTFSLLIEEEKRFQIRNDLRYKAIQESIAMLITGNEFDWVSATQHLKLAKYLYSNLSFLKSVSGNVGVRIRSLLDYTDYLLVFIDARLSGSNNRTDRNTLDSLMDWTMSLLLSLSTAGSVRTELSDVSAHLNRVVSSLHAFSDKHRWSVFHWVLHRGKFDSCSCRDAVSLLLKYDFDCNIRTEEANGNSVLHFAYIKQELDTCLLLLRHGAYPLSVNRFDVSFMDEVVKCPTVLPFTLLKKATVSQSNEFIRSISRDPVLKKIWVNFSRLPYKLSTLTAQCIVKHNIPYTSLSGSLIAFVLLHDSKKFEHLK